MLCLLWLKLSKNHWSLLFRTLRDSSVQPRSQTFLPFHNSNGGDIKSVCISKLVFFSSGKYVCHHAVSKRGSFYVIGGECFTSIYEAIEHYQDHPLGAVTLTSQVGKLCFSKCTTKYITTVQWNISYMANLFYGWCEIGSVCLN